MSYPKYKKGGAVAKEIKEACTYGNNNKYRISSPISLVIFSVFDTKICEIFHQKQGSAYS